MALNQKTLTPLLTGAAVTLLLLATINNVGALKPVRSFIEPSRRGWF